MITFSEGQEIELKGVITYSRQSGAERKYFFRTGEASFNFRSRQSFANGDAIILKGVFEDLADFVVRPVDIKILEGDEAGSTYKEVEKKIISGLEDKPLISENSVSMALKEKIKETAGKLVAAKELNRYILVRFHGDADGIAGAIALRKVLRFRAYQQNSAIYTPRDAVNDLGNLHNESKPLVVLLDFSSNRESIDGLKLLRAGAIETMIIDHHPMHEEIKEFTGLLLSPWLTGVEDASKYTAGYLASEIANLCGAENAASFASIACAGDKSDIMPVGEEEKKTALVLDYLAAHTSFGNSLDFYEDVLQNRELFSSIWQQASEKINNALAEALARLKKSEKNGISIYIVPLDGIVAHGEFPNRSKVTTAVFEHFRTDSPMVTIGYGKRTVITRGNNAFLERGLSFSDIIKKVSADMKDFVSGGGGHAKAAAMRVEEGYEKSVVDRLIEELK